MCIRDSIKSIKNISSIFAGFVNNFHSDKPGMLPTINTILLTQCLDHAASVSLQVRKENKLNNKYPNLAFFTGFHRHGALRNPNDSFTANFCHPDALTALIGARILNQMSPKIQVSPGVHNIECQYIKSIKNISSIFAGFVNNFHSDKPGMLPTINTILLTQCLDQAASVSVSYTHLTLPTKRIV